MKKQFLLILTTCFLTCLAQAQFNDILKRKAEEGVKRGAEAATEKTIDKVVDKSLGKIFNKGEKKTIHRD